MHNMQVNKVKKTKNNTPIIIKSFKNNILQEISFLRVQEYKKRR
jgi:hypothetical protein